MIRETVILAGGRGERLKPLTDSLPKPLLPVNKLPVLSRVLREVEKCGITHATLSLGYGAEKIKARYGNIFRTLSLSYSVEEAPLGTAGGVKKAALRGDPLMGKGDILVLSGDVLFEGDLTQLIDAHSRSGADVTIAAKSLDDVSGFGVMVGSPRRIEAFVEKPDPESTPSHVVNLGIYVISSRVLAEIPDGAYDFGKELFPALLEKGYTLSYCLYDDYWCDVGRFSSYLDANLRLSSGKSCIGSGCTLPHSATVEESVLLDGVTVGEDCRILRSILGENVTVAEGVKLENCVIGEGCAVTSSLTDATVSQSPDGLSVIKAPQPVY